MAPANRCDVLIIGAGFYGCCLALFARSVADRVTIVESSQTPLGRASAFNQARIHTGFHYPRSFATAKRSLQLYRRFMADFEDAVFSDFRMLYAIARQGSKVSSRRFFDMYRGLGAPIRPALRADEMLFDARLVESVFECEEYAFDADRLRELLVLRLERAGVDVRLGETAEGVVSLDGDGVRVDLASGSSIEAKLGFNATYARLNALKVVGTEVKADLLPIKHELAEIALVSVPSSLERLGVTVMDGPFFSLMPFPARKLHSLTHVRYTPQLSWLDRDRDDPSSEVTTIKPAPRWVHMKRDASRYMPAAQGIQWQESLFEVKTVLQKNEFDDGRPIFLYRMAPDFYSILGGKLDNIYDLFECLQLSGPQRFQSADLRWFSPR